VCEDEIMGIKAGNLKNKVIIRALKLYDFPQVQISNKTMVVSWCSPCAITPWKLMDHPRDNVAEKGMPETRG
jgi:hypothetical protein